MAAMMPIMAAQPLMRSARSFILVLPVDVRSGEEFAKGNGFDLFDLKGIKPTPPKSGKS
jgi:hypothetical protein